MVMRRVERIGEAFAAESAAITGDVVLGAGTNIWFGAVLRGDDARITIGERTNIQDLTMVHADPGIPNEIDEYVTVGHSAILHGKRIGARTLIGMGAILLTGSVIGEECLIGAGAVVTEGMVVPPRSLVLGMPGRVVRSVTDEEVEIHLRAAEDYYEKALEYVAGKYQP